MLSYAGCCRVFCYGCVVLRGYYAVLRSVLLRGSYAVLKGVVLLGVVLHCVMGCCVMLCVTGVLCYVGVMQCYEVLCYGCVVLDVMHCYELLCYAVCYGLCNVKR